MDELKAQDRRKLKRKNLLYYLPVIEMASCQVVGHLIDLTPGGFGLDSQYPIPLERYFHLGLDLEGERASKDFIEFTACSKWRQVGSMDCPQYHVGFEIVSISPQDARIVERILDQYGARDLSAF